MLSFTDQTGRTIFLPGFPQRIISLVPSQTELLASLGLDNQVVGITRFCIHPTDWFRPKKRVGGTKQINTAVIHDLKPDLIIANKEENVKEQIEELAAYYPVWVSDVNNLPDACTMIEQIGCLTGKEQRAREMVIEIKKQFSRLPKRLKGRPRTAYLIWQDPYMTIGGDSFIHSMLEAAGFQNIFGNQTRYPEISIAELQALQPDLLLLSSEPFPFKQQHADRLQALLPSTKIMLVDGEMFSWYGSHLLKATDYLMQLAAQAG